MKHVRRCASWGLAVALIIMSPVVLIFGLPFAIGIGLDIIERAGETPLVLVLCLPVALVLAVALVRSLASARPHFGRPARLL